MLVLIEQLTEQMGRVDPEEVRKALKYKPARHERVVGKASDDLLRLLGVVNDRARQGNEFTSRSMREINDFQPNVADDEVLAKMRVIRNQGNHLAEIHRILKGLFWESVKIDFPEARGQRVGIREGGMVVVWEDDREPCEVHTHVIDIEVVSGDQNFIADLLGRLIRRRR